MSDAAEADFDDFYRNTARRVIHLVHASTGDLSIAQECAQEAYARAWQRWSTVSTHDDPLAWVRTVARRLAISRWRSRQAEQRALVRSGEPGPAQGPTEDRIAVLAALDRLDPKVREAVVLYYFADLTIERISHETDTPTGTIKSRLYKGRRILADALRTEEAPHE